jgi:periplasmic protein TonB
MDYARQQRDPGRHAIGIVFVVAVHALVIYALMTGLARQAIEVIKKPLNATIIEELKLPPPPPPPPKKIVEAPKVQAPVQPYVPPPDIPVPTTSEAVISAPSNVVPVEPHVIAPPVVAPPAPPPPKPAIRRGIQRIGGDNPEFPKAAIREGIEKARVVARLNIDENGNVTEVNIVLAEPSKYFDRAVIAALKTWKFRAEGEKYVGEVEVNFKLSD